MNGKKKILTLLLLLLVLLAAAAGAVWCLLNYYVVGFRLYPRNAAELDLRSQEISVKTYEKLTRKMPDSVIRWNVPFQSGVLPDDTVEVTVSSLTQEDVAALAYLPRLKIVHAESCRDYEQLVMLKTACPQAEVRYLVTLDGTAYPQDSTCVEVSRISQQEIAMLQYLPELDTVVACGDPEPQDFSQLHLYCRDNYLDFCVRIGDDVISQKADSLYVEGITEAELNLMRWLSNLKQLHIVNPQAPAGSITGLREAYPDVEVSWETEIGGLTFQDTDTVVDLSTVVIEDLAQVEEQMAYLPDARMLILGLCGIDNPDWGNSHAKGLAACKIENEDLAAYRDRVRENYKVVWTVRLGPSIALRTDADNFMPGHYGVGRLFDSYAYNLRYCEDMVCLDVGHMTLTDISFVSYMPHLKYLILAWTEVQYIEPIRSCKELVFLELDNSCIRDYSPVADCTALEDLNIGKTFCDITPILEMTWLKNLYMIFCRGGSVWQATQALTDTNVVSYGSATVDSGWRRLPNYYDMRDCLGVPYMDW